MSRRAFDRFMVDVELGSNPKIGRFTDGEFRCLISGVWALAAKAEPRGYLVIAGQPATDADVAHQAHCSKSLAAATLARMRALGMLETEDGLEHVHDWEESNPAPKTDTTAAERQRRKRERDAQRAALKESASRRDGGVTNGVVTPPEVEEEVEAEPEEEAAASVPQQHDDVVDVVKGRGWWVSTQPPSFDNGSSECVSLPETPEQEEGYNEGDDDDVGAGSGGGDDDEERRCLLAWVGGGTGPVEVEEERRPLHSVDRQNNGGLAREQTLEPEPWTARSTPGALERAAARLAAARSAG